MIIRRFHLAGSSEWRGRWQCHRPASDVTAGIVRRSAHADAATNREDEPSRNRANSNVRCRSLIKALWNSCVCIVCHHGNGDEVDVVIVRWLLQRPADCYAKCNRVSRLKRGPASFISVHFIECICINNCLWMYMHVHDLKGPCTFQQISNICVCLTFSLGWLAVDSYYCYYSNPSITMEQN